MFLFINLDRFFQVNPAVFIVDTNTLKTGIFLAVYNWGKNGLRKQSNECIKVEGATLKIRRLQSRFSV